MKCPKCGYNSFEFLDSCKKCNNDLAAFKEAHAIRAIILPFKQPQAAAFSPEEADAAELLTEGAAAPDTGHIFSWDTPAATAPPADTEEAFAGFGTELSPPEGKKEAELFSFDMGLPPDAPAKPGGILEETTGEFSFEELCGEKVEQPKEFGNSAEPLTEDSLADLLESTPGLGSPVPEGSGPVIPEGEAPPATAVSFGEESFADLLESAPAMDGQPEEGEFAIPETPESAPLEDDSLAGLLESAPDLGNQTEEGGFALPLELEPTAEVNPLGEESLADLLEPTPADCGQLGTAAASTPAEFASGDLQEFGEEALQEEPLAMGTPETPPSAEDFDFEEYFREEEGATPAEPVKGTAIEALGLSKDEFDALFGEAAEAEKARSAG